MSGRAPGFIEVGGHHLECAWIGPEPGAGPTLVFLHQGLGCVAMWNDFPARLAAATGLGAFVYSRLGHGKSGPAALPWPVSFMHDEALDVLPALLEVAGIDDFILVGHSDGASISLIYAGGIGGPGLRGLVLEAPHVMLEELTVEGAAALAERYESGDLGARLAPDHGANTDAVIRGWTQAFVGTPFSGWNIEEYLPAISVPALVIQGQDDAYGTMAQPDAIAAQSGAPVELLKLDKCGHAPHHERPDDVLAAMAGFVTRNLL
jgi:pimeloyl-ACP methyl ester carboxylesterase